MNLHASILMPLAAALAVGACGVATVAGPTADASGRDRDAGARALDAQTAVDVFKAVPPLSSPDSSLGEDTGPDYPEDATTLVYSDASPDGFCGCVYHGDPPQGSCATPGETCWPAFEMTCEAFVCGPPTCKCVDAGWACNPVGLCK